MTGRVRSLSSRSGQAPCWPRIAEVPLQGLKTAGAFVLGTCAGVSERLAHDGWGRSSFPSEKAFSSSRKWCGMTTAEAVAVRPCVARMTDVCWVIVGRDWGTHQSRPGTGLMRLSLARFGMIGGDKISVVVRGFL